jgi:hypothetical protein
LYSRLPDLSSSSESKTASVSFRSTLNPSELTALKNSFLSTVPDLSSSHARKRSTTREDERASASLSDHVIYSAMSTRPLPSSSSALKRSLSSLSVYSPSSRSRTKTQNSPKSSLPSLSASAASRSAAFCRMPVSKSSSPVPASSPSATPASFAMRLPLYTRMFAVARLAPFSLSAALSSWNSIQPLLSSSMLSKSASMACFGASYPRAAPAIRISYLSRAPLPSSSHSRKRSISLIWCSLRIVTSCSCTLVPLLAESFTIDDPKTDTRAPT